MTQLTDQSKTSIGPSTLLPSPALHPLDLPSKTITKETSKLTHANASAPSPSHTVSSPPKSSPPLPQTAHANQSYPHPLSPTAPHKLSISIKAPLFQMGKKKSRAWALATGDKVGEIHIYLNSEKYTNHRIILPKDILRRLPIIRIHHGPMPLALLRQLMRRRAVAAFVRLV